MKHQIFVFIAQYLKLRISGFEPETFALSAQRATNCAIFANIYIGFIRMNVCAKR